MTNTPNHPLSGNPYAFKAKALEECVDDWASSEGITDATMLAATIDRQTEATLALAFEQRTANLIAVTNLRLSSALAGANIDAETDALYNARLGLTEES